VTIGPSKGAETLRTGLAMGADSGIHIETPEHLQVEPLGVAKALQTVLKKQESAGERVDLIIMGKQAIDDDMGQTGQVLAGLLGWGQATFASSVTVSKDEKTVNVRREIDGGMEELAVRLPAVITTDLRYVKHNSLAFDPISYP
jgi:electron transfer flavoprotein beta subunit